MKGLARFGLPKIVLSLLLVLMVSSGVMADRTEIVIVHQNDLHGHLTPFIFEGDERGGLARMAGFIHELRDVYEGRVLWLDGGDTLHGTTLANAFYGESVVEVFNEAGLDVMVLGNHDFNYGRDLLSQRIDDARFAVLSANVVSEDETIHAFSPYTIVDVGGINVGIIGLTTPATVWATHPDNVIGLAFQDATDAAAYWLPMVKDEADLVILLTHLGHEEDRRIAEALPDIDVIVGGHSHSHIPEPITINETLIVQANEYGKFVGVLRLVLEDARIVDYDGALLPVTSDMPELKSVNAVTQKWEARLTDRLNEVVSETSVHLDGERDQVRTGQTNLGVLVAESMRHMLNADIGFVNGGSIRASIDQGMITYGDVYHALPFDNTLVGLVLSGQTLREMLEHSFIIYPEQFGGFLQVAGVSFTFDPDGSPGERITDMTVNGARLEMDRMYTVALTDFLAAGGDGYAMLIGARRFFGSDQADGIFIRDVFIDYMETVACERPDCPVVFSLPFSLP